MSVVDRDGKIILEARTRTAPKTITDVLCYSAKRALWACSPQSVQENGLVGSLVNRLTAPSTGQGMPMPPQAAPPPSPMPPAAVPQPSFQLPPMANMASNAPNGLLGQHFGGGMPA
jgi:hypothetical protein